jgi:hypothetical protein
MHSFAREFLIISPGRGKKHFHEYSDFVKPSDKNEKPLPPGERRVAAEAASVIHFGAKFRCAQRSTALKVKCSFPSSKHARSAFAIFIRHNLCILV